jgi:ABC-type phosphate transport system, periplasmic component
MKVSQAFTIFVSTLAASVKADGEVFTVHGSGTTNPSKCIWHIMSLFEERSLITTRLTYRAIGSSFGQREFLGVDNTMLEPSNPNITISSHAPHSDFGSGDIPISTAAYEELNAAIETQDGKLEGVDARHMVHLPFAMSSVSFFHNIPGVPDGKDGLKLSPCLLARIFNGKIQQWDSQEILDINGHIKDILSEIKTPIYVARRVNGSSSTKSITEVSCFYIHYLFPVLYTFYNYLLRSLH